MPPKESKHAVESYSIHRAKQGLFKTRFTRFKKAYQTVRDEQGVNISAQSIKNFRQLYQDLKKRTNVPAGEKVQYGEKLLSDAEKTLWITWRHLNKTLKHASKRIDFDVLKPLDKRLEEKGTIHNAHTGAMRSRRMFSYFSLGIGEEYASPGFLPDDADVVIVHLSQLGSRDREDFYGLWISNDIYHHEEERRFFDTHGTTTRYVFCYKDLRKVYRYVRGDGQVIERTVHYQDEIFAADHNMDTIFDALFFQFIIELRMIGGTFQQQVYAQASNHKTVMQAFHQIFPSRIYPEAKLSRNLDLRKPYVKKIPADRERTAIKGKWFEAIRAGDIHTLKKCLVFAKARGVDLIHARTPQNESALMWVFKCDNLALRTATLNFLLEQGEQVYHKDGLAHTVFHRAIDKDDRPNFERLLQIVGHALLTYEDMALKIFVHCLENGNSFVEYFLNFFQAKKFSFPSNEPVITNAYVHLSRDKARMQSVIQQLLALKANSDAINVMGMTPLMLAAENGDLEMVQLLVERGAQVNLAGNKKYQGVTPLHLACKGGHVKVVEYLLQHAADPNFPDAFEHTPYSSVVQVLEESVDEYLFRHSAGFRNDLQQRLLMRAHLSHIEGQAAPDAKEVADDLRQETLKKWEENKKVFETIKSLLEEWQARPVASTALQMCNEQKLNVVVLVTGEINGQRGVIMGRQKDIHTGLPRGYYRLPGGGNEMENPVEAAKRELWEETHLRVPDDIPLREIFKYRKIVSSPDQRTYFETVFYHLDLGTQLQGMSWRSGDDLTAVTFVPWRDITKHIYQIGRVGYFHRHVRVMQSNALLVDAVVHGRAIEERHLEEVLGLESGERHHELAQAIQRSDQYKIIRLIQSGLDINDTRAISVACAYQNFPIVDLLVRLGGEVNRGSHGLLTLETPLIAAINNGNVKGARHLIQKHHADINLGSATVSPLSLACARKDMQALLEEVLAKRPVLSQGVGGAALLAAMSQHDLSLTGRLLETEQVDLNQHYVFGTRFSSMHGYPLVMAFYLKAYSFIPLFLEKGASLYVPDDSGMTLFKVLAQELERLNTAREAIREYSGHNIALSLQAALRNAQQALSHFSGLCEAVHLVVAHAKEHPHPLYEEDVRKLENALNTVEKEPAAPSTVLSSQ